ncbi:hypothetical protein HY967_04095 [Candidatus Jorgensenbacteria bacterium]|nr:hypothetical protein [Candidatus Jorgensenbacteria bacterium]
MNLKKQGLLLIASTVFLFVGAGIYFAEAQTTWFAPTQPFPYDQPGVPLDTTPYEQEKPGSITISTTTPLSKIKIDGYQVIFNSDNAPNGSIYWAAGKLMVRQGSSVSNLIGGGNIWQATTTGVWVSSTVRVGVGTSAPDTNLHVAGGLRANYVGVGRAVNSNTPLWVLQSNAGAYLFPAGVFENTTPVLSSYGYALRGLHTGSAVTSSYAVGIAADSTGSVRGGTNIGSFFGVGGNSYNTAIRASVGVTPASSTNKLLDLAGLPVSSGNRTNYTIYSTAQAESYFAGDINLAAGRAFKVGGVSIGSQPVWFTNANGIYASSSPLRVGIGTESPGSMLSVTDGLAVGADYVTSTSPQNGAIFEGKVGIGVNDPQTALQVGGSVQIQGVPTDAESSALIIGRGEGDTYPDFVTCPVPGDINSCGVDAFDGDTVKPDYTLVPIVARGVCAAGRQGDFNDVGKSFVPGTSNVAWIRSAVHCESVDEPKYTIRNKTIGLDKGNIVFANKDNVSTLVLDQNGTLTAVGSFAVNTNFNGATTTPRISLKTNVTNSNKGVTEHQIFGPYNSAGGDDGALYIGAGRSTNNNRNSIYLYNLGCTGGTCNVPAIHLNADEIKVSSNAGSEGTLMVGQSLVSDGGDGNYYAVYAP